jgi:hypothetical protein
MNALTDSSGDHGANVYPWAEPGESITLTEPSRKFAGLALTLFFERCGKAGAPSCISAFSFGQGVTGNDVECIR